MKQNKHQPDFSFTVERLSWHRNGISGEGFYAAIGVDNDGRRMLVVRFSKQADKQVGGVLCAAFALDELAKEEIGLSNHWRGDWYADAVDAAIREKESNG